MNDLLTANGTLRFPKQISFYQGKVRDVYNLGEVTVMIASDRLSAFDRVFKQLIPGKGQVLTEISNEMMQAARQVCPNHLLSTPAKNTVIVRTCEPVKVEMVIRGYLTGSLWREYQKGNRQVCGVRLPDGMQENDRFPEPIITPTTKAEVGQHDLNISVDQISLLRLASSEVVEKMCQYTRQLFKLGTEMAAQRGLILVDTKYEFGLAPDGEVILIDEIHTPDSSRFYYRREYEQKILPLTNISKEFVRKYLMEQFDFCGEIGQSTPALTPEFVGLVSTKYAGFYHDIIDQNFVRDIYTPEELYELIVPFVD